MSRFALTRDIAMAMQLWNPPSKPVEEPESIEVPVVAPIRSDRTITTRTPHVERGSGNKKGTILW